jgi:hypothetical protein
VPRITAVCAAPTALSKETFVPGLRRMVGPLGIALLATSLGCSSPKVVGGAPPTPGRGDNPSGMGQSPSPSEPPSGPGFAIPPSPPPSAPAAPSQPLPPDQACAKGVGEGRAIPPVLEFVIDTSQSMNMIPGTLTPAPPGESKWDRTRDALIAATRAMRPETPVGLFFYPMGSSFTRCIDETVGEPIAPLNPAHLTAVEGALQNAEIGGSTPTHDGYVVGWRRLEAAMFPGEKYLVLITDGEPVVGLGCQSRPGGDLTEPIVASAAEARMAGIGTFVIGSHGSENARGGLSAIAKAGGSGSPTCSSSGPEYCHFDLTTQADFSAALSMALEAITERTLGCKYQVPPPPGGQTIDPTKVNVRFTRGTGEVVELRKDPSATACNGGWQYADGGASVQLCEAACNEAKADPMAKIEVLFGCATRID